MKTFTYRWTYIPSGQTGVKTVAQYTDCGVQYPIGKAGKQCKHKGCHEHPDDCKKDAKYWDCCEFMRQQLNYTCNQHSYPCPDVLIVKGKSGLYLQSPNAEYEIKFCPSCGSEVVKL